MKRTTAATALLIAGTVGLAVLHLKLHPVQLHPGQLQSVDDRPERRNDRDELGGTGRRACVCREGQRSDPKGHEGERHPRRGGADPVAGPGRLVGDVRHDAIDKNVPMSIDDHFRIGSNTKTMTSTVILQLVQEGKLSLDDPISKFRPASRTASKITIEQLAEMRSGLYSYTFDPVQRDARQGPAEGMDAGRAAGDRLLPPAELPAGREVRLQQHQHRAARRRHRAAHRDVGAEPSRSASSNRSA